MATFKSIDDLMKYIQTAVTDSLQNETKEAVREEYKARINEDVYKSYTPSIYPRRGENGGLLADENIIGEMLDGNTLSVRDVAVPNVSLTDPKTPYTPDNDTRFASWIEEGNVPNIFNDGNYAWMEPRPFTQNTINELERNKAHVEAMKKGLKIRGIDTK